MAEPDDLAIAKQMLEYINASDTQFHAVAEASTRLLAAGFEQLSERAGASTLVAFAIGEQYQPGGPFYMIGAHTDSPCWRVKPISKTVKSGYQMVNVEPYGGLLHHTWFDRDLTVAGRVLADGKLAQQLVRVPKPILRIPMLAIHLQARAAAAAAQRCHCIPLLANSVKEKLESGGGDDDAKAAAAPTAGGVGTSEGAGARHHPLLLRLLAQECGCDTGDIVDFDLNVVDTQAGVIGGGEDEYVFVGRLDNLCSSYLATTALIDTSRRVQSSFVLCTGEGTLAEEAGVRAVALFDHEECGSDSAQGAGGPVMRDAITRVTKVLSKGAEGATQRALQSSMLVSADMAHALHPNYEDKHDSDLAPRLGCGLVLKHNSNQRYATNAVSATLFRECCRRGGVPTAEFAVRNDMACGSTIGPILASGLGVRTVDIGVPQLAMHSIRETCAVSDVGAGYRAFLSFFRHISDIDAHAKIVGTIRDPPCSHQH
eukprot:scaffold7.g3468.t1